MKDLEVVLPLLTLSVSPQPVEATDDAFWDQFWADTATSVQDVFALVPAAEIRAVREESPSNLATLCYKVRLPLPSPSCCAGRGCPCVAPRGSREGNRFHFISLHPVLCLLVPVCPMITLSASSLGLPQTTASVCSVWSLSPLVLTPYLTFACNVEGFPPRAHHTEAAYVR